MNDDEKIDALLKALGTPNREELQRVVKAIRKEGYARGWVEAMYQAQHATDKAVRDALKDLRMPEDWR